MFIKWEIKFSFLEGGGDLSVLCVAKTIKSYIFETFCSIFSCIVPAIIGHNNGNKKDDFGVV